MSEQDWSKVAIFDVPPVRQDAQRQIQIERPAGSERAPAVPPPDAMRAVLDNPQAAELLWQQVGASAEQPVAPPTEGAQAIVQMSMALYFLHSLHFQGKPGHEHLDREDGKPPPEPEER